MRENNTGSSEYLLCFELKSELVLRQNQDMLLDVGPVLRIDQSVVEDSAAFMDPQRSKYFSRTGLLRLDHQNALEHLRHISQVE